MGSFSTLIEVIFSHSVEFGGGGIIHGGKGILKAGASKIGWSSSNGRKGKRLSGHSISNSGVAGLNKDKYCRYNPKNSYKDMAVNSYKNNIGIVKSSSGLSREPIRLFGRAGFKEPNSKLGRNEGQRYCRKSSISSGNSLKSVLK